jgi:hypothetical protein
MSIMQQPKRKRGTFLKICCTFAAYILGNTKVFGLVLSNSNLTIHYRVETSKPSQIISLVYGAGCCFLVLWGLCQSLNSSIKAYSTALLHGTPMKKRSIPKILKRVGKTVNGMIYGAN